MASNSPLSEQRAVDLTPSECSNSNSSGSSLKENNWIPPRHRNPNTLRFQVPNDGKLQLKDHIFISKDCTYRLSQHIVQENWGKQCSLLYKYLDYIFRCQCFKGEVLELHARGHGHHQKQRSKKRQELLVFHSGLQRRADNAFLYVLLVPNSISKLQRWRVQFGNIRNSFVSKRELLAKLAESGMDTLNEQDLPKRTKFTESIADLLFDDTRSIQVLLVEIDQNKNKYFFVIPNKGKLGGTTDNESRPNL